MRNRPIVGHSESGGYEIWGPVEPPARLGIHGTSVAVDHDLCVADGACLDCCEVNVFEWVESPNHPTSPKKSAPVREKDCLFCTACKPFVLPRRLKFRALLITLGWVEIR